nr:AraC family ligand binding domain-containing protein [Clostridia bacterium]
MQQPKLKVIPRKNIVRDDCSFYIHKSVNSYNYPLHSHEFFEFDIVVSGKGRSNINGTIFDIQKNTMLFFTPADFHDIVLTSEEPVVKYNIAFPTDMIYRQVWSYVPMNCRIVRLSDEDFESVCHVCRKMHYEYKNHLPTAELIMKTGIEWCLLQLADAANSEDNSSIPTGNITAVLAYIYDNFTGNV